MRVYVMTTGTLFGLIVLAHLLRIVDEGTHVVADPWWVLMTLASAALSVWAWRLLRLSARP